MKFYVDFYPVNLPDLHISSSFFFVVLIEYSLSTILSFKNNDSFNSSSVLISFFFFFWFYGVSDFQHDNLKKGDDNGISFLFSNSEEMIFYF